MRNDKTRRVTAAPIKMPTGELLAVADPGRDQLRDIATSFFGAKGYGPFREWLGLSFESWRESPTACFLHSLALLYQVDAGDVLGGGLDDADQLLTHSTALWRGRLPVHDLQDRDATLLFTSIELAQAWVLRLRGDTEAARDRINNRIEMLYNSGLGATSPEIFHCPLHYGLTFANQDKDAVEVQRVLGQAADLLSTPDTDLVTTVACEEEFAFVRQHDAWETWRSAAAQSVVQQLAKKDTQWEPSGTSALMQKLALLTSSSDEALRLMRGCDGIDFAQASLAWDAFTERTQATPAAPGYASEVARGLQYRA